jgi:hypothetical protein
MSAITIRYTWQNMVLFACIGGVISETLQGLNRGIGSLVDAWSDPLFWSIFFPLMLLFIVVIWYLSAVRLSESEITSHAYPFKILWSDLRGCTVSGPLGILGLKLYGAKSRFPIWLPLPPNQITKIYDFLAQKEKFSVALTAFEDIRLKKALQRTPR